MKVSLKKQVLEKLDQINDLVRDMHMLIDRGNRFTIRAGYVKDDTHNKWGLVDVYDPTNKTVSLIACYEYDKEWGVNFQMQAKGIYQAIKYIPITAVSPGSFDILVDNFSAGAWDEQYMPDEDFEEDAKNVRLHLLACYEQYGVELQEMSPDELQDMEYEHDTIYNSGKVGSDQTNLNSDMPKDRLN